jgi:hypothetical protein
MNHAFYFDLKVKEKKAHRRTGCGGSAVISSSAAAAGG